MWQVWHWSTSCMTAQLQHVLSLVSWNSPHPRATQTRIQLILPLEMLRGLANVCPSCFLCRTQSPKTGPRAQPKGENKSVWRSQLTWVHSVTAFRCHSLVSVSLHASAASVFESDNSGWFMNIVRSGSTHHRLKITSENWIMSRTVGLCRPIWMQLPAILTTYSLRNYEKGVSVEPLLD